MGRELKRVALDFSWPVEKVWGGYINPFSSQYAECPECGGSGYSPQARVLKDRWYGNAPFSPADRDSAPHTHTDEHILAAARRNVANSPHYYGADDGAIEREARRLATLFNHSWCHHLNQSDVDALVNAGRRMDFTHEFKNGWQVKDPPYTPTAAEVNAWSCAGFGHDAINQWICVETECLRLGHPTQCAHCHGSGELWPSPEIEQAHEQWERTEPPTGDGYQIWETVSEGSPISPVFATPEELAGYMAGRRWGADKGSSYESWLAFINGPGFAMSMVINATGIHVGPDAAQQGEGGGV